MMTFRRRSSLFLLVALTGTVGGLSCASPVEAVPPCRDPAPLLGQLDPRAPGYIVVYRDGTEAVAETDRLAAKYGFTPRYVYKSAILGFGAELSAAAVSGIRCEQSVDHVSYDAWGSIAASV